MVRLNSASYIGRENDRRIPENLDPTSRNDNRLDSDDYWAIKQMSIASSKTMELQHILIRENYERELAKEVINLHKELTVSLDRLLQAGNMFDSNFHLESSELKQTINFSASNLVEPVNEAYQRVCSDINRLDMWLKIAPSLPHADRIQGVINAYLRDFLPARA